MHRTMIQHMHACSYTGAHGTCPFMHRTQTSFRLVKCLSPLPHACATSPPRTSCPPSLTRQLASASMLVLACIIDPRPRPLCPGSLWLGCVVRQGCLQNRLICFLNVHRVHKHGHRDFCGGDVPGIATAPALRCQQRMHDAVANPLDRTIDCGFLTAAANRPEQVRPRLRPTRE